MQTEHLNRASLEEVYLLQHSHAIDEGNEDNKIIGIYSSKQEAELAIDKLKIKPGFRDWPERFYIDKYKLNEDNWIEGFHTC